DRFGCVFNLFCVVADLCAQLVVSRKVRACSVCKRRGAGKREKSALERMAELKEMRDKNLISQVEYERKKDDIMKEL
ncbi:MAG: SHOCT domain-containing protein, partial [Chloroflexi bacterium]|nr:SHOCT domain-containing protein [Chloroflexota bacterium]